MALVVKNPLTNAGDTRDTGLILVSGSSLGERYHCPLQCPCLENSKDRGAWQGYSPWGYKEVDMTQLITRTPL